VLLCVCVYTASKDAVQMYVYTYIYPPDPINHVCSLTGEQISENYLTYRSVQYLKSCSEDLILQNLILPTRLCGTGFITQPSCVLDFSMTEICQAEMICIGGVPGLKRHFGRAGP